MTADAPASITTERLLLRRWRERDLAPFGEINADPDVMEFMPRLLSRSESDALVERIDRSFDDHGYGLWAVELIGSGEFIGFTGLGRVTFDATFTPAVEVGWRLARPAWGRGYASEAARAAVDDGFARLELAEIVSFTAVANHRSRRVMERLGMTRDPASDFDHPSLADDDPLQRHVLYRLARES